MCVFVIELHLFAQNYQPQETRQTKKGDGYLSEEDMISYIKGPADLANRYATELQQAENNPFFRLLATRLQQPPNIYPSPHPGLEMRPSGTHGVGVFCVCKRIEIGTYLGPYCGKILTRPPKNSRYTVSCGAGLGIWIDGFHNKYATPEQAIVTRINSITRWDGTPGGGANAILVSQFPIWPYVYVEVIRPIYFGEEVLLDYHWFKDIPRLLPCAPNCKSCAYYASHISSTSSSSSSPIPKSATYQVRFLLTEDDG